MRTEKQQQRRDRFARSLPGSFYLFFSTLTFLFLFLLLHQNSERVFDEIERLVAANPGTMRLDVIEAPPAPTIPTKKGEKPASSSSSTYFRPLRVVTVEPGGLSPGPPGSAAEREAHASKYRLLLNYGEHGRELVTVESALVLLRDLAAAAATNRTASGGGNGSNGVFLGARAAAAADADPLRSSLGGSERLRNLLKQAVFKIVPMENEAGRELVEAGQLCERKNGRGVRESVFSSSFFPSFNRTRSPPFFFSHQTKKKNLRSTPTATGASTGA